MPISFLLPAWYRTDQANRAVRPQDQSLCLLAAVPTTIGPEVDMKELENRRPATAIAVFALLLILGVGAVGGGIAMVVGIGGESFLPDAYLDDIPLIDNWVVPGLILGIGFGLGSLITAYGVWRRPRWSWAQRVAGFTRHHWAWLATLLLGLGHVVWILIELVSIPFSFLMPTFGLVGLALSLLPLTSSFRSYLADRAPEPVSTPSREDAAPVAH